MFMGIRERIENPTPILNKDPILQKYEEDTATFVNRFRDRLQGSKKPTPGE